MERQFLDDYGETRGAPTRAMFWLRTLRDLATSISREVLRELRQDLLYAFRVHRRSPVSTILAFSALTLAIGATTGVFSVVNALLLRSLPFAHPERLVEVRFVSYNRAGFYEWLGRSDYLQDAAAFRWNDWNFETGHESFHAGAAETTANFFSTLGTQLALGRPFSPGEDVPGQDAVVVIGYGLWLRITNGGPSVLGTTIRLNGIPLTVIGVAPPGFDYPNKAMAWTPSVHDFKRRKFGFYLVQTIGRLKPGITMAQAEALHRADLQRNNPRMLKFGREQDRRLVTLRDRLAGPVRQASLILLAVVCFVLLVACANVAYLLLSRFTERRHELALRMALGASRARLTQQLATEAMLLTVTATATGLVAAHWAARLASHFQPALSEAQRYTVLDWRVIGFAAGLALLTGLLFGVLPTFLLGRLCSGSDVYRGQSGARTSAAGLARKVLVAFQAALTLALLAGSVNMGRAFLDLMGAGLGFRTDRTVTMRFSLWGSAHDSASGLMEYYREALDRLRAAPGVEAAGAVDYLPMADYQGWPAQSFQTESGQIANGFIAHVTPDYFRAMGIRILEGRDFTAADGSRSDPVIIVNEDVARGLGPLAGKRVFSQDREKKAYTVVGVVSVSKLRGPLPPPGDMTRQIYLPMEQERQRSAVFVVRVQGNPESRIPMLRDLVQQVDRGVPMHDIKTLDQRLSETLAGPRFYTTAVLFLGGFALLLSIIGIYGVAAHATAQRTQEIGVRIAVGADPRKVRWMLLLQGLAPVTVGLAFGAAAALGLGKYLNHLIESAQPVGTWTCAAAALLLASTGAIAVWTATSRILRIDPMRALRTE
jgi:putative ABC transport system permease protein